MRASQQMIIRADAGRFAVTGGAIDGDIFTEGVAVANLGPSDAPLPFQVLSFEADAGEGKNLILLSQTRAAIDHHMGMEAATRTEDHLGADHAKRPNHAL